jgi:hypothetical protein
LPSDEGPSLAFDWELAVFRGARRLLRAFGLGGAGLPPDPPEAALLAGHERALSLFAQMIAGRPLRVRQAAGAGGVVGSTLYLPRSIATSVVAGDNSRLYLVRVALSAAQSTLAPPRTLPADPVALAALEAARAAEAGAWLTGELPGAAAALSWAATLALAGRPTPGALEGVEGQIEALRRAALSSMAGPFPGASDRGAGPGAPARGSGKSEPVVLWGELCCADPALDEPIAPGDGRAPSVGASQAEARPVEKVELVHIDKKQLEDAVLVHTFEKIETADSYNGGARDLDGSDELEDHAEALDQVPLGKVIRSPDAAHAVLRADVGALSDAPDVEGCEGEGPAVAYDEWDIGRRAYRRGHCTVYPAIATSTDAAWAQRAVAKNRALIADLSRRIEARRDRLAPRKGQPDGDQVDLDALVRHLAERGASHQAAPRLYIRRTKQRRDVATTVLLDVSLSSDAWIDGRRVLDLSREAAIVLGEVAERLGDPLQILCFSSNTRSRCHVWEVRGWATPWAVGLARLGGLVPQGYTRIGAALRHATSGLASHPARRKLLLMVGDAKPTDYDRYEGPYGVADVRQAVREADRLGVRVHGITVDPSARDHLPAMLGPGRCHLVRSPAELPLALTVIYSGLLDA